MRLYSPVCCCCYLQSCFESRGWLLSIGLLVSKYDSYSSYVSTGNSRGDCLGFQGASDLFMTADFAATLAAD